jgi:hypothetical protein
MTAAAAGVAELVRALALAWKNLAAYPRGHPALADSLEMATTRLTDLRGAASDTTIGIAADGLVFGQEKFDFVHAQKLALALYMRGVAIVRFTSATDSRDLETFLRVLGVGSVGESRRAIWEELTEAGVTHIELLPVDFSSVLVTDNLTSTPSEEKPPPSSLWDEILRALMAGRRLSGEARSMIASDIHSLDELSAMIIRYVASAGRSQEYEVDPRLTFGIGLTAAIPESDESPEDVTSRVSDAIGGYVGKSKGLKKQLAVQQVAQLLKALPENLRAAIIEAVLRSLASEEASASQLRDFTASLSRDEILEALRSLAKVSRLSSHATKMLQALLAIETPATDATPPLSPDTLSELAVLFGDDDVDRFNPPDHRELLDHASLGIPKMFGKAATDRVAELGDRSASVTADATNRQLQVTLIDLITRYGSGRPIDGILRRLEALFRSQLNGEQFEDAIELIEQLQIAALTTESAALRQGLHDLYERLANQETLEFLMQAILTAEPEKLPTVHRLTDAMGPAAMRGLLIALAGEENRSRRRRLFSFAISFGTIIVPEATRFLSDARWYVVRNMLALLRAVNDTSSLPEIQRCAQHPDLRVRLEAIKTLFTLDTEVPQALLDDAINDPDPKIAETAIGLVGSYGIKEAVKPLLHILAGRNVFGKRNPLRMRAIKALGEIGAPAALPRLQQFFSDSVLPWPPGEERRAAYESLAGYPGEVRRGLVEKGLKSRDAEVRKICRRLIGD